MISTHFPLSFPIKILGSVVCKSHEVYAMTNGHCSLQLGSGGTLSPPAFPGQRADGVQGAKTPEALEILHLPRMPEIHPRGPFTLN